MTCRASEVLLSGPAGTGKSRAALEKLHLWCDNLPNIRALIVRKTRESLTESALVTFEEKVVPANHFVLRTGGQRKMRQSYHYRNGSVIVVGGMDKPGKIMSTEYDYIFTQESIELTENDWESLTTRLRNGVAPYQQLLADTNPDRPTHWLKKRCDAGKTLMLESRHEDNPVLWDKGRWTPGGLSYIAKLDALTGPRKQRLRYGRWVQAEGVVYDGWDAALHVIDRFPIPMDWPRYWSVDFGFTNPLVIQFWAVDPDGRLYLYREIYQTQTLIEDAAREVLRIIGVSADGDWSRATEPAPQEVVCDHDAEGRATLERYLKIGTTAAWKDVQPGIQAVAARLRKAGDRRPRLFILRDSLVRRDGRLVEAKKPTCTAEEVDGYCFIAGTQIETERGPAAIESVKPGVRVWTRQGLRRVLAAGITQRSAPIWTATFSNGVRLSGTAEHPIFVQKKGWVALSSMSSEDIIEAWNPLQSRSMASSIDATQNQSTSKVGFTIAHRRTYGRRKALVVYTSICGDSFMVKCRTDATSIIGTITLSITPSRIWSVSRLLSMSPPIAATLYGDLQNGLPSLPGGGRQPCRGEALQKGVKLRDNEQSGKQRPVFQPNGYAKGAESHFSVAGQARPDFAPGLAIPLGEPLDRRTTKIGLALTVVSPFAWTSGASPRVVPVRVRNVIEEKRLTPVYNLTVEDVPEYYANGVLVHNCWDLSANRKQGEEPLKQDDHGLDAMRYLVAAIDVNAKRRAWVL